MARWVVKFGLNDRERSDTAVMDAAAKTKADAMDAPFAKTSLKLEGKELLKQAGKQAAVGAGLGALVGGGISAATDGDALQGAAWCAFSGGAGSFSRGIFVNRFKASSQALSASSHNAKNFGKVLGDWSNAKGYVPSTTAPVKPPTRKVFHKGELLDGKVGTHRELSTGVERESVEALQRPSKVHEFEIPEDTL